jgi:hypothetical protein
VHAVLLVDDTWAVLTDDGTWELFPWFSWKHFSRVMVPGSCSFSGRYLGADLMVESTWKLSHG